MSLRRWREASPTTRPDSYNIGYMLLRQTVCTGIVCVSALLADTAILKNGRRVEGTYLGGDSRSVRMASGDRVETLDVIDIRSIEFGGASAAVAAPQAAVSAPTVARGGVEVPAGTRVVVRLIDDVDSERDSAGKTYRASLDEAIVLDGRTIVPRNGDVTIKLVEDKQSGKLAGRTVLTLDVVSMVVNGRTVDVHTSEITQQSGSQGARTAKSAAGLGALGAVIGGIAGGGSGAAIGAASGAAVGAGSQVLLKGQRVRIPSETRLSFLLEQPVQI